MAEVPPFAEFVKSLFRGSKILGIQDEGQTDTVQVSSSCLSEVSYNLDTRTLTVTFLESGATYEYYGIPESVYENLVQATSVGQEYVFTIRNSGYGQFYNRIG
jgi:hypothetical protein